MNGFQIITILTETFDFEDMDMMPEPKSEIPIIIRDKSGRYLGVRCVVLSDELMQEYRDFQFQNDYEIEPSERWLKAVRM
ncbi:MAG: hypothetical protein ABIK30_05655 [bacterium]